ncbi:MAG: hypothetical protein ABEJ61_08515 [Haloferacaceae archaeon]
MARRRGLLKRLAGATGVAGLAGCSALRRSDGADGEDGRDDGLPARQHAMNAHLRTDAAGNPLTPRHHAVLLFDLTAGPSSATAETVETAMRTLESAYEWSSRGLFARLAWGTSYFSRVGALGRSPIRRPRVLSRTDDPDLLAFDGALVLSSDVPSHVAAAEAAMFGSRAELGGDPVAARLGDVAELAGRRTGFVGEGLPAAHADAEGVPADAPLEDAPMFTGFFSGRRGTQASEERVTIDDGRFAGGTTMHLSHLTESLGEWWNGLDDDGRVARMFSAALSPSDVAELDADVPTQDVRANARTHDVVGHFEKVARARRDGDPVILRRDFNTVDGGQAGVHFLSLQASLDDFVRTRKAMNGWWLRDDSDAVTDRENNGLLNFVTVRSRANFYLPPRNDRALPLR